MNIEIDWDSIRKYGELLEVEPNYLAMDGNLDWYAYEFKPKMGTVYSRWTTPSNKFMKVNKFVKHNLSVKWYDSLTEAPVIKSNSSLSESAYEDLVEINPDIMKAIEVILRGHDGYSAFIAGNIINHIERSSRENAIQELNQAKNYLDLLIDKAKQKSTSERK